MFWIEVVVLSVVGAVLVGAFAEITKRHYAHFSPEHLRSVVNSISGEKRA